MKQLMEGIYKNLEGDAREEWAKLTTTIIASELKCATCNNIIEKKSQPEVSLEMDILNTKTDVPWKTLSEVVDAHFSDSNKKYVCLHCGNEQAIQRFSIERQPQVVEMSFARPRDVGALRHALLNLIVFRCKSISSTYPCQSVCP